MSQYHPLSSFEAEGRQRSPSVELLNRDGYGLTTPQRAASPDPSSYSGKTQYDNFAANIEEDGLLHKQPEYRLYKRRFFGLATLTLINTVIGSDGVTFSVLSSSAAEYFDASIDTINWLSTAGSLAFIAMAPIAMWVINRFGVKHAVLVAGILDIVGNWFRYAGTASSNFPVMMVGSVIISMAQPFVQCAPTQFSKTWFSDSGRTSATALPSLTSFLGEAIASLLTPYLAEAVGTLCRLYS